MKSAVFCCMAVRYRGLKQLFVLCDSSLMVLQVPDNYLRAIFGSYLASRFVYEYGSSPSQFAFYDL